MKMRPSASIVKFSWANFWWMLIVHSIAIGFAVSTFSWQAVGVLIFGYYLTGMIGITFGFHRMLAHRGFQLPRFLENFAALAGTLACEGGPVSWVGTHRQHHQYSDKAEDPHDSGRGFWFAHWVWLFQRRHDLSTYSEYSLYAPDMAKRPFMVWLDRNMILLQFIYGVILFAVGGLLARFFDPQITTTFSVANGASYVVWGVFVRLIALYHVTWFVNSACHTWGFRTHNSPDKSRNLWWVGILAFGEGWHNNHHAQARTARHGWEWWQIDQTWYLIRTLELLGIARNVVHPRRESPVDAPVSAVDADTAPSQLLGLDLSAGRIKAATAARV